MQSSKNNPWVFPLFTLLTLLLGVQLLRADLAYFRWLFGDRFLWSSLQLGGLALGFFSLAVLVGPLLRRVGIWPLLLRAGFVVGLARLLAQIWWGDPLVDAVLVFVGLLALLLFLPAALAWMVGDHIHKPEAGWHFGLLLLSALALDSGIHSVYLTYDPIWQNSWIAFATILFLVGGQWLCLRNLSRRNPVSLPYREGTLRNSLPLLLIGPFFVYHLIVGGNLGRLNALTEWAFPVSAAWLLAGQLLAVLVAWLLPPGRAVALVAAVLLMFTINPPAAEAGLVAVSLLVSQLCAGLLLTSACTHLALHRSQAGVGNTAWLWWGSMILFVLLVFVYYVTYDIRLPINRDLILYLVVVAMGAGVLFSVDRWVFSLRLRPSSRMFGLPSLPYLVIAVFLLFGLTFAVWHLPPAVNSQTNVLRIFNYNSHNGFDTSGTLDLEAMARLVETQRADIVTLQEVSRGLVINGSVDMAAWFSWRLGTPIWFHGTAGKDWGNALLTHHPVARSDEFALPPPGLPLARGFAYYEIVVGEEESLFLINTHLHHISQDARIREQQIASILHFLDGSPMRRLIFTGDLNSLPMDPVLLTLQSAGLRDLVTEAGVKPDYTFPSDAPVERLDYILASPDIGLRALEIAPEAISDHLGIGATIVLK